MEAFKLATPNDPNAARPDHVVHPDRIKRRLARFKPNPDASNGPITVPEIRLPMGRDSVRRSEMDEIIKRAQKMAEASIKDARKLDAEVAQRRREVQSILTDAKATPAAREEAREIINRYRPQEVDPTDDKSLATAQREQEENTKLKRVIAKHQRRANMLGQA